MTLWTPHVAIRLHQVCSSQRVYLKGEPGPARVVGRPWGSLFCLCEHYQFWNKTRWELTRVLQLTYAWKARGRLRCAPQGGPITPPAADDSFIKIEEAHQSRESTTDVKFKKFAKNFKRKMSKICFHSFCKMAHRSGFVRIKENCRLSSDLKTFGDTQTNRQTSVTYTISSTGCKQHRN